MRVELERFWSESEYAIFEQRTNIRSVEGDLFKYGNRKWWQRGPKKRRPPDPARNEQCPAVNRRLPKHNRDQGVNQRYPVSKKGYVLPRCRRAHAVRNQHDARDYQHDELCDNDHGESDQR